MTDGDTSGALTVWLAERREEHDRLLTELAGPLLDELTAKRGVAAAYFERINKPDWGVRLWALGDPRLLAGEVRPFVEARLTAAARPFAFAAAEEEDKWVGGATERPYLMTFHQHDSRACLEWIAAERRGDEPGSRAQFALLVAEGILARLGLDTAERLEFDRRGFAWEMELGRWDEEVFAMLEAKFRKQQAALRAILANADGAGDAAWGGPLATRMGRALLASVSAPLAALVEARRAGHLRRPLVDFAVFAARAHVNRIGLSATQEATIRFLVWRARGGTL